MEDEKMPARHSAVFDGVQALLRAHGFTGMFVMLIQEDEDTDLSNTGLLSCMDSVDTMNALRTTADQLALDHGVGEVRQ